jgi:hypothetical protein
MTLFNDTEVKWGGVKVGGIRISHLSHVERDIALSLTATKGKKEPFLIRKLEVGDPTVLDDITTATTVEQLNALRPRMKGVPGAIEAARAKADQIRAAVVPEMAEDDAPI